MRDFAPGGGKIRDPGNEVGIVPHNFEHNTISGASGIMLA